MRLDTLGLIITFIGIVLVGVGALMIMASGGRR